VALLLLVALAITLAGIFPFRQMIAQQRQVAQTRAHLETLRADNATLEASIAALQTDAEVERLARENGLVRPGETGYSIELDDGVAPTPVDLAEAGSSEDRTLLERVWDFLTGRDLVPDG
jgi:cell division protein FtsB